MKLQRHKKNSLNVANTPQKACSFTKNELILLSESTNPFTNEFEKTYNIYCKPYIGHP